MSEPVDVAKLQAMAAQLARPNDEADTAIATNINVANARLAERAIAALGQVSAGMWSRGRPR